MCFGSVICVTQEVLAVGIALGRCGYLPAPGEGGNAVRKSRSVAAAALSGNWHSLCFGMSYVNTAHSGQQFSSLPLSMGNLITSSNSRTQNKTVEHVASFTKADIWKNSERILSWILNHILYTLSRPLILIYFS